MNEQLGAGLQLSLVGIGLVFMVLALLWGLLALMLRLDRGAEAPIEQASEPEPPAAPPVVEEAPALQGVDPALLSAITIAVLEHRRIRRQQAAPLMRSHLPGSLPSRWLAVGRARQNQSWQPPRR